MSSVLLTGGAGYIGSHVLRELLRLGRSCVVIDNLVYGHRAAVPEGIPFYQGCIDDKELLAKIFEMHDISAVLHFAAYAYVGESVHEPLKYYHNNTAAPLGMLQVMQKFGCKKIVFSSTCATYGNPLSQTIDERHPQQPINPYGWSKWMLEKILIDCEKAWGLRSAILRYFNASGADPSGEIGEDHDPETHLIPLILMAAKGIRSEISVFGTDYETPDGSCVRDYIHVSDLAEAHGRALQYLETENQSLVCNLGTGEGVSVLKMLELAKEVTQVEIPTRYVGRREGDPAYLVANATKAKEVLGWKAKYCDPRYHLETAWNWMNQSHGGKF